MTDTLTDGTTTITLEIDREANLNSSLLINASKSIGGNDTSYLWHEKTNFQFPIKYIISSEASVINDWWRDSVELDLYFDSTSYDVYLMGQSQPFKSMSKPYNAEWNGILQIRKL